ncbi:MAG: hypothetical protein JF606_12335 [Burkholderiales bacterium]|nr:hypothetical protein [Burkholderiales bacterium]
MTHGVGDALVQAFSDRIAACTGLRFDAARHADLHRAIDGLTQASESGDARVELGQWLARPWLQADIETLARHLCVGETYFFREPAAFDLLEHELLPPLIAQRRTTTRTLRVWSAGCSTGEEVYSVAIMLSRLVPDHADWDIVVLGTDIHRGFLARAEQGVYSKWSFRGVPDMVRDCYFDALDEQRFAVKPMQKRLTQFCYANLAQPVPAGAFDLILCRNVLIYFDRDQARSAVRHLRSSLTDDGLLQVGATEASAGLFDGFREVRSGDMVVHRKLPWFMGPTSTQPAPEASMPVEPPVIDAEKVAWDLVEALTRCEIALLRDKCDAMLHLQHAALLEALLRPQQARDALRRALFLDPTLVLARAALHRLTWVNSGTRASGVPA